MESLAHEQEGFFALEKSLSCAGYILVRRVSNEQIRNSNETQTSHKLYSLRQDRTIDTCGLSKIIMDTDEVKRRRYEYGRVGALDC